MNNWSAGIRFRIFGTWQFDSDEVTLYPESFPTITVSTADPRLSGLRDPKFGTKPMGLSGDQLFARLNWEGSVSEAYKLGIQLQHALMLLSVQQDIGIDPGFDDTFHQLPNPDTLDTDEILKRYRKGNVHFGGLEIFQNSPSAVHGGGVYMTRPFNDKMAESWSECISNSIEYLPLNDAQVNALYLYNFSRISRQLLAIVSIVSAIEAATPRRRLSKEAIELIDQMRQMVKDTKLEDNREKESLLGRIENLKQASIRSNCLQFIRENLSDNDKTRYVNTYGKSAEKIFDDAYNLRSGFLHDGYSPERGISKIEDRDDLWEMLNALEELVPQVLLKALNVESRK